MSRFFYLLLIGLVLSGIIHIAIVLLLPSYGTRDAWAFLSGRAELFSFTQLSEDESKLAITEIDPFFSYGFCRFDLNENALRMEGTQNDQFWSVSVFDENGTVIYGLNNRTAIEGRMNLLIVNPLQTLELRENQPEKIQTSVVIEANIRFGFVIVRILKPDETWQESTNAFLNDIECGRFETAMADINESTQ